MATASKKPAAKKPASKKVAASAPVKKARVTTKKSTTKAAKASEPRYRSFRVAPSAPLMTFAITRQTIYWLIIISFIIFFQLWIIKLQYEVSHLLQVQQQQIDEDYYSL